jgi:hypothetical protein
MYSHGELIRCNSRKRRDAALSRGEAGGMMGYRPPPPPGQHDSEWATFFEFALLALWVVCGIPLAILIAAALVAIRT